jgi:hypothetical protein
MTTMRLIAYLPQDCDADAARGHLAQQPGITRVACRNGRYWSAGTFPEPGYDAVFAPVFPQIQSAYAARGVKIFQADLPWNLPKPDELDALPQADHAIIVCPGKYVELEITAHNLAAIPGVILAVNEAARIPGMAERMDYFLANDGFVRAQAGIATNAVRVTRRQHWATIPGGSWYALDRLGITGGLFTVRCALCLAREVLKAKSITLIGHDCTPGIGTGTEDWTDGHIEVCRNAVRSDLIELAEKHGITVRHLRWDEAKREPYVETYAPPEVTAVPPPAAPAAPRQRAKRKD